MSKNVKVICIAAACLLLALTLCMLFFIPSNDSGDDSGDPPAPSQPEEKEPIDLFLDIVEKSDPTRHECSIVYEVGGITLRGEYLLRIRREDETYLGEYTYRYDKLSLVGESSDFITEISGKIYTRNEKEIAELRDSMVIWTESAEPIELSPSHITKDIFESYEVKEEENTLSLTAVLKNDGEDGAVGIVIKTDSEKERITEMLLEYTDKYGASVKIKYLYSYAEEIFEISEN